MPNFTSKVMMWFQRENGNDIKMTVSFIMGNNYYVHLKDSHPEDSYETELVLPSYESLSDYIDIFVNQLINDRDTTYPITHFQYTIPHFSSVIMPFSHLRSSHSDADMVYARFVEAFDFYFTHASV